MLVKCSGQTKWYTGWDMHQLRYSPATRHYYCRSTHVFSCTDRTRRGRSCLMRMFWNFPRAYQYGNESKTLTLPLDICDRKRAGAIQGWLNAARQLHGGRNSTRWDWVGQYGGRTDGEGMTRHPRTTYYGERILQYSARLGCGSGGRDAGNGPLMVEKSLQHCK